MAFGAVVLRFFKSTVPPHLSILAQNNTMDISTFTINLVVAMALGAVIGLERQLRQKSAGLRTNILVSMGAALYVLISLKMTAGGEGDVTRIIGQIVTGIGFLGAGVMLSKDGVILGVTSAATIWVLAAIGVIIPIAGNLPAIKMALLVLVILLVVNRLEAASSALTRGVHMSYSSWRTREVRPGWFKRRFSETEAKNRLSE
mgnify:CR=1 FL=1